MRSRIFTIIILLSLIVFVFALLRGIKIGNFQILSIYELIEKNDNVNSKIEEASILTTREYSDNLEMLEGTFKEYKTQKQKYESLADVTEEITDEIYETKQYDIVYLWRVFGNYAKKRSLGLGIEVEKGSASTTSYNIKFKVWGQYTSISQFITDIENDSDLYFRIYDFHMTEDEKKNEIISTFTVRNVNINPSTITQTTEIPETNF